MWRLLHRHVYVEQLVLNHRVGELSEQVAGVVRPRAGLGVILNRHYPQVAVDEALERVIVQVNVRDRAADPLE